jgi:all-trans-8'-apo-beta-carotenal 15,15'-oxygenase
MQSFQLHERASTVPADSYQREDWQKGYESVKHESITGLMM